MFDGIHIACVRAADQHGSSSGDEFNSSNFSSALRSLSRCDQTLDDTMVEYLLLGRDDVYRIGWAHWKVLRL